MKLLEINHQNCKIACLLFRMFASLIILLIVSLILQTEKFLFSRQLVECHKLFILILPVQILSIGNAHKKILFMLRYFSGVINITDMSSEEIAKITAPLFACLILGLLKELNSITKYYFDSVQINKLNLKGFYSLFIMNIILQ